MIVEYIFIVIIFASKPIEKLRKAPSLWYCKSCLKKEIPLSNLNDYNFQAFTSGLSILPKKKLDELAIFEINAFTENEESNCKYPTIDKLNKINIAKHGKKLSLMHLNTSNSMNFQNYYMIL